MSNISRDRNYLINVFRNRASLDEQTRILGGGDPSVSSGGLVSAATVTIYNERLVPNGTATAFSLTNNYRTGTIRLYVDGLRYTPGGAFDYTETGSNTISFVTAPPATSNLLVDYDKL